MTVIPFRSNTVLGLRRLADDLAQREGIALDVALDRTARGSGFQGFADAVNRLYAMPDPMGAMHPAFVSGYWRRKGSGARVTVPTQLPVPLARLVTTDFLRGNSTGHRARLDALDHLELRQDFLLGAELESALCFAEWGLAFMAYSGLRAASSTTRSRLAWLAEAPSRGGWTLWECPDGGGWVYIDSVADTYNGALQLRGIEAWVRRAAPAAARFETDLDPNPASSDRVRFFIASGVGMLYRVLAGMDAMDLGPEPGPLQTADYGQPFASPERQRQAAPHRRRRPARSTEFFEHERPFLAGPGSAFAAPCAS
jgi:hypothetical protein